MSSPTSTSKPVFKGKASQTGPATPPSTRAGAAIEAMCV
eukprot:CAMPEP_0115223222 /NCGR_PEP_ID=MMETSP0270-20121206/28929_1 /TAXON_ID=71861 /ORGANISM="Scrippsiella trochoidea, Strain CCMP3099" /LENGTH=38 /DNA_ID= /DNA_START= /DNA_END= /DNA_ORIENTATION=